MSIRAKVIGCFLVILGLFGGVSVYNYLRARESNARLVLVNELFLPLSREVAQIQSHLQSMAEDVRRYYFHAQVNPETSTLSRMARDIYPYWVRKKFHAAEGLLAKAQPEGAIVHELQGFFVKARNKFDELSVRTEKHSFEAAYRELRHELQAIAEKLDRECQKVTLAAQAEGRENLILSLVLSTVVLVFGAATVLLSHRTLSSLPSLIDCVKKIADGDFTQSLKVKISDKDEIAQLAREYNRMLDALSERDRKIQRQQNELLQAERLAAVGQLSAEVVHEIRNPLNAISLNIDWLESELTGTDPEVQRTLRSISREVERLHQITESYLLRARMPVASDSKAPVNEVIQEILAFSREEARSRNIEISTSLCPEELFVRTDRSKLKQALLNVFRNATEAMPRGGRLSVVTEVKDNVYRIRVSDSGYGMNDATRAHTFHPFFTTKPNGTGLGLTLTKAIVEEARGTIHCDSQIGKGTTFTFQFPV